jgi:hypothetical protein
MCIDGQRSRVPGRAPSSGYLAQVVQMTVHEADTPGPRAAAAAQPAPAASEQLVEEL